MHESSKGARDEGSYGECIGSPRRGATYVQRSYLEHRILVNIAGKIGILLLD